MIQISGWESIDDDNNGWLIIDNVGGGGGGCWAAIVGVRSINDNGDDLVEVDVDNDDDEVVETQWRC